jgi:hypothetical protein
MLMTFNSIPFKTVNESGKFAVNQTIYEMECNAFEIDKKDDYNLVIIHHFFPPGKIKVDNVINPQPPSFNLT